MLIKGKYVMSAIIRGEGSNKLENKLVFYQYGRFWTLNVTDENFMDPLKCAFGFGYSGLLMVFKRM